MFGRAQRRSDRLARAVRAARAARPLPLERLEPRTLLAVAELVKDINANNTYVAAPAELLDVNGTLFFTANQQLYRSDGTDAGTVLVTSRVSGAAYLTRVGATFYFASQSRLWTSDGTDAGTREVSSVAMNPRDLTAVNGRLYFRGADAGGDELWTSDGTASGTYRVADINPGAAGSTPRGLTASNGRLFFEASDGVSGRELWTSDGTASGTSRVRDIAGGADSAGPTSLTDVNGTLFFAAQDGGTSGYELWKSDGTETGTVRVRDIRPGTAGSSPMMLQNVAGRLMFLATDGVGGYEIWSSDGTAAGTVNVRDIIPGGGSPSISNLRAAGNLLFFTAGDGSGQELWTSDGTAGGTVRVKDINPGAGASHPASLVAAANGQARIFFTANDGSGQELWTSDGTEAGTVRIKDIRPGWQHGGVSAITASGSGVFFIADDGGGGSGGAGAALWRSDGTTAGTVRVRQFHGTWPGSSSISGSINVNGNIFFSANDSVHGQELWRSDGTETGTQMVLDLAPGEAGSYPQSLTAVGGALYFTSGGSLYTSDGSAAGTILLGNFTAAPSWLTAVGSTLYFVGVDSAGGRELWKSDGTAAGTVRVRDIVPGSGSSNAESLVNLNGTLFFAADDGASGHELWKSDGTEAGTVRVRDIVPGAASSGPLLLTNVGGRLFFRAGDPQHGYELWTSDGTETGTHLVKDIRPGAEHAIIANLIDVNGTLFFAANDGVHGHELWKSDGTEAGTVLVRDIYPGPRGSSTGGFVNVNGTLFLHADGGAAEGNELWKSDGTEAGTILVKDLRPGSAGSGIVRAIEADGKLAFVAHDGGYHKTWLSDGTEAGTFVLVNNWNAASLVARGQELFLDLWNWDGYGGELHRVSLAGAVAAASSAASTAASEQLASPDGVATTAEAPPSLAAGDTFYDGAASADKPDPALFGLPPIYMAYEDFYGTSFDRLRADETQTRALAQKAAGLGLPVGLNIEHWPVDLRWYSEGQVQYNIELLAQVVDWVHDERPDVSIGFYGIFPVGAYPAPLPSSSSSSHYASWHAANERLRPLAERVDFIAPDLYTFYARHAEWHAHAEAVLAEMAMYGKPVLPFLWMRYHFDFDAGGRYMPPDFWRAQLEVAADMGDGAILWNGPDPWSADIPWWTVTRDFLLDSTPGLPAAPTALVAAADANTGQIKLTWSDNAFNETGYRVERRVAGESGFTAVATLGRNARSYTDTAVTPNVDHAYRVVAVNTSGDSLASSEQTAQVPAPPTAPTALSAVPLAANRIELTWAHGFTDADGFEIERSTAGGPFALIATLVGDIGSHEDTGLSAGVTYTYRVRAFNAHGESGWSPEASATTPTFVSGLRAHWRLDENSSNLATDSAGDFDGTLTSGPAWSSGTLGSALSFDGVDDHVVVPDGAGLRFAVADSFTLSTWVSLASLPNGLSAILAKANGSVAPYGISLDASNRWIATGVTNLVGPTAAIGWTHVAVVQDGIAGTRKLYINGVEVAAGAAQAADGAGDLWFGAAAGGDGSGGASHFAGKIDDVRLYDRALTADHLAALANPHVVLTGSAAPDVWIVRLNTAGDAYEFLAGGALSFTRPLDAVGSISVLGNAGDDQLTVDFSRGQVIPLYGLAFDGGSGVSNRLHVIGASAADPFTVDAAHVWHGLGVIDYVNAAVLDLAVGTFAVPADLGSRTLRVTSGATVNVAATQRLNALTVGAGARVTLAGGGGDKVLVVDALALDAGALLDLADNDLIQRNGSTSSMFNWIASGAVFSSARTAATTATTLGMAPAAAVLDFAAGSTTALFAGQSVTAADLLVKYTWAGDANLDGLVSGDDYTAIDFAIAQSGATGYWNGDFNYDGLISGDDYTVIDFAIAAQGAPL